MRTTLELSRNDRAPALARRAVTAALGPEREEVVLADAALLVSELVTNSVRHGAGSLVWLHLDIDEELGRMRCEVLDGGGGCVTAAPTTQPAVGGWGLRLVDRLATRWGIDGGRHVWFELTLASERSGPAELPAAAAAVA